MAWVVFLDGTIEEVAPAIAQQVVDARLAGNITAAQAQSAMARGSARRAPTGTAQANLASITTPGDPQDPAHASADIFGGEEERAMPDSDEDGRDLRMPDLFVDEEGRIIQGSETQNGHDPDSGAQLGGVALIGGVLALRLALAALRRLMGSATRITQAHWDSLPGPARTALAAIGIGVGVDLALDIPGVPGESFLLGGGGADGVNGLHQVPHMVDGHLGDHIVGKWEANGVTFYRLSNGKLAVQNKLGRWKVWKPKKPVVLMPDGANNLRTLLKADRILNSQAKKIAAMLNRRAPRARKAPSSSTKPVVIIQKDGQSAIV